MKKSFPERLNEWRLTEGPLATDDSSLFEGCFIIPSPFAKNNVIQVRSSELANCSGDGCQWEHVSAVVKKIRQRRHSSGKDAGVELVGQRRPNDQEITWLRDLFWSASETVAVFLPRADAGTNQLIANMWRPSNGWHQCPERFRDDEDFKVPAGFGIDDDDPVTVADLCRELRQASAAKEARKHEHDNSRKLHDLRRLISTVDAKIPLGSDPVSISAADWAAIKQLAAVK